MLTHCGSESASTCVFSSQLTGRRLDKLPAHNITKGSSGKFVIVGQNTCITMKIKAALMLFCSWRPGVVDVIMTVSPHGWTFGCSPVWTSLHWNWLTVNMDWKQNNCQYCHLTLITLNMESESALFTSGLTPVFKRLSTLHTVENEEFTWREAYILLKTHFFRYLWNLPTHKLWNRILSSFLYCTEYN